MTSYALRSRKGADSTLTWEIKSVNARFLDVQIKLPFRDLGLEQQLKKIIKDICETYQPRPNVFLLWNWFSSLV